MEITTQEYIIKHIAVTPVGRIDAFSVPELQTQIDALLQQGNKHFILNLEQVDFMDSAGLAVLVKLLKRVKQLDGTVNLVMPVQEAARRILRLTHFDQIFETAESVASVVNRL